MQRLRLLLSLEEEVSISSRAASSGGHDGLAFIPGSALLGVAAQQLYRKLSQKEAFTLFHSGKVRFGNLYPISASGLPMFPIPLSWQIEKTKGNYLNHDQEQEKFIAEAIFNGNACTKKPSEPKQLRAGFVSDTGEHFLPTQTFRMKTAIDPKTGMADKSKIFGYQALAADSLWYADIEYEDSVAGPLIAELKAVFEEAIFFGRSRSAEYGKAKVYKIIEEKLSTTNEIKSGELTLWLQSDLCLVNDLGMPVLQPEPAYFGLTGEIDWSKTFIRSRRFVLFNSYRRTYEPERVVINAGSVLTFTITADGILENPSLYPETGLGRFILHSPLLQGEHPSFQASQTPLPKPSATTASALTPEEQNLLTWLKGSKQFDQAKQDYEKEAKNWLKELREIYPAACRFAGAGDNFCLGPSASQWGSVMNAAKAASTKEALFQTLFTSDHAICRSDNKGWEQEFFFNNRVVKFANWFKAKAENQEPRLIQIFASLAMKEVQNKMRQGAHR